MNRENKVLVQKLRELRDYYDSIGNDAMVKLYDDLLEKQTWKGTISRPAGFVHYDPSASWNKESQFRPMHWDPKENWNHNLTVADMMHKDSSAFYDNISRSVPSESDVVYANEGGKRRKSRKVRKNRKVRKSRKH
jgi:hypothetical protein